jgi:DNA-directed RNA polymerase subunit K/omega
VVHRAPETNRFEFVVTSALRAHQLRRGCAARVEVALKSTTTAQLEVVAGKVSPLPGPAWPIAK